MADIRQPSRIGSGPDWLPASRLAKKPEEIRLLDIVDPIDHTNRWNGCILVLILVGFCIRPECAGVTSFIRAACLDPGLYKGFLHFFNYSTALDLAF